MRMGQSGLDEQRFSGSRWLFSRCGPTEGGSDGQSKKEIRQESSRSACARQTRSGLHGLNFKNSGRLEGI
jgi:hypothetical protein